MTSERLIQLKQHGITPPEKVAKPCRICTVIPHLKDNYWLAVDFGLVDEAKRLDVLLTVYEAGGGYENFKVQRQQIADCISAKTDTLVIGAILATGFNDLSHTVDGGT